MQKTMWKVSWMHAQNCGAFTNCKDMKRFGGPGTKKKACIRRCCWSDTATGMYSRATRLPYMAHTMSTGMPAQARKPNTIHCISETKSLISCNLPKYFVHRLPYMLLHPQQQLHYICSWATQAGRLTLSKVMAIAFLEAFLTNVSTLNIYSCEQPSFASST